MNKALEDVLAERERQKTQEGWSATHDDSHTDGALAIAAGCYALSTYTHEEYFPPRWPGVPKRWPWSEHWWKPRTYREDLVRAGALILAELERLDRAAPRGSEG